MRSSRSEDVLLLRLGIFWLEPDDERRRDFRSNRVEDLLDLDLFIGGGSGSDRELLSTRIRCNRENVHLEMKVSTV